MILPLYFFMNYLWQDFIETWEWLYTFSLWNGISCFFCSLYTDTHVYTYTYVDIHMCMCVLSQWYIYEGYKELFKVDLFTGVNVFCGIIFVNVKSW